MYQASTLGIDHKVRTCAEIIGDGKLISKLLAGDMIAQAFEYHLYCLIKLYRQAAACQSLQDDSAYPEIVAKAQAFSELVEYLESLRGSKSVLSMAELYHLYTSRLASLGITDIYIHRTRFR